MLSSFTCIWEMIFQKRKEFSLVRKKLSKTALLFLAITIHNFPEGLAVGVIFGALAGGNMTLAGLMGAALVMWMMAIIPYALAFAAGAMIFVVTEELIPESQANGNTDMATLGLMVGFVVMMVMDVALG